MRLEETIMCLANLGDGRANLMLDITKGKKNPVFWYDAEDDICQGEWYLTKDDKLFTLTLPKKTYSLAEIGDMD